MLTKSKPPHFSCLILALCLSIYIKNTAYVSAANMVIKNNMGVTVQAECKSEKDYFGIHSISLGQEFGWTFTPDFFGRTTISCDFLDVNDDLAASFEVYNEHTLGVCVKWSPKFSDTCYWETRADGFYFNHYNDTDPPTPWAKKYDWH